MALAGAKLFVDEGAHVFISGRRQEALDEAVKLIGRNVTGVQADSANLDDLDRLFDAVRREKGAVDVLWTSAGTGEERKLGEITEQHFDATFGLNARGTLFTVQKAFPLFNDGGSIFMTGSIASVKGFPFWSVYAASKAVLHAYARVWLSELKDRRIRVNVLTPGQVVAPGQEQMFDDETKARGAQPGDAFRLRCGRPRRGAGVLRRRGRVGRRVAARPPAVAGIPPRLLRRLRP